METQKNSILTAAEVFGAYATAYQSQSLDAGVLHHAKRAVLDWHAALLAGKDLAPVPQLRALLATEGANGRARLVGGGCATARGAALLNGTAAHAAEVDDSFRDAMYHPGAATISAALSMAQETGASGMDFLRAVILGYEVSTRIGVVLGREHYKYWHNTGSVGIFGAAAATASILGLKEVQFAHALATAATFSSGLQQAFRMDSMSKPLHPGRAAEGGVFAGQLAACGVTGSLDILDGNDGLGQAMSNGPDWSQVGTALGADFNITRLTFKNHVGCGHTFAAIDGALSLMQQHRLRSADIEHVLVATYGPALDIACYDDPRSVSEARFSVPFVVATAMTHGSVRSDAYTADRLFDPHIRALMGRITTTVDPVIDAEFPRRRSARVEVQMHNGQRYVWYQPDRKGDPELPLSDAELDQKFLHLEIPVIGQEKADELRESIWTLEHARDLTGLIPYP